MKKLALAMTLAMGATWAQADGLQALDGFVKNVQSGTADFTQKVTTPAKNGQPGRVTNSSGTFAFDRPGKFRFDYVKPFPQLIVGDGKTLWVYDEDLNQATSRAQSDALESTPAAILSSATSLANLEKHFTLQSQPAAGDGLQWVQATPKQTDGQLKSVRIGFDGQRMAALDIVDNFEQKSELRFQNFVINANVQASQFQFVPPEGADVMEHSD